MSFDYDIFVIGAGFGGIAAAKLAAAYGARVAISEREQVGGTCVVPGYIHEKLMAYAARFSHVFEDVDEYGWGKVQHRISWQQFMTAKNCAIERLSHLHIQHLQEVGVKLIYGQTKFLDAHTLDVG